MFEKIGKNASQLIRKFHLVLSIEHSNISNIKYQRINATHLLSRLEEFEERDPHRRKIIAIISDG